MKSTILRRLTRRFFLYSILSLGIWLPNGADAAVAMPKLEKAPSNEVTGKAQKIFFIYGCYCDDPVEGSIPIPCTFEYKVTGLAPGTVCNPDNPNGEGQCDNGGHKHNGTRPLVFTPPGKVEFAADEDGDPLIVKGNTLSTPPFSFARGSHSVPQAGGVIEIEGTLTLPQIGGTRWFCISPDCFDLNTRRFEGTIDVHISDLKQLPNPGPDDLYEKLRGGPSGPGTDGSHKDSVAFAGSAFTLRTLPLIAEFYFSSSGRTLSVNDVSLPKGGVFDLNSNWKSEHQTHRNGDDVDINTGGVDCLNDFSLRLAADQFLFPLERTDGINKNRLTALLCEGEGFKHLDMVPLPSLVR